LCLKKREKPASMWPFLYHITPTRDGVLQQSSHNNIFVILMSVAIKEHEHPLSVKQPVGYGSASRSFT
jgi:hypothetical protein